MGALNHLHAVLLGHGLQRLGRARWEGPGGRRVDASRRRLVIRWPMAGGPVRPMSFWARRGPRSDGLQTGDLAFDGDIQILGAEADVRRWMNASARAAVRWLLLPGDAALRLRADRVVLLRSVWRPALFESLELLSHPRWNAGPAPFEDADPRVRALAALHATRRGTRAERSRLVEDEALPVWIRLEAAFAAFREAKSAGDELEATRVAEAIGRLSRDRKGGQGRLSLAEAGGLSPPDDSDGQTNS